MSDLIKIFWTSMNTMSIRLKGSVTGLLRRRPLSTVSQETSEPDLQNREAWLYVDSVFPIQLARWDFRYYVGLPAFRSENLLATLQSRLETVNTHGFRILVLEPQQKDGGVLVKFSYRPPASSEDALKDIELALREHSAKRGGIPSWLGLGGGNVWIVKGKPWKEDMNRYASPILKIAFDGPDVQEQWLYELCRPYGRINDLSLPMPVPTGTLRSSTVTFKHVHAATVARNVIHGYTIPSHPSGLNESGQKPMTRLHISYQQPIQAHLIRDWMSNHPKIMLPLLVFLVGTLTYTIFDPIRSLMVQGKMLNWFNYRESKIYQWFRINALERLSIGIGLQSDAAASNEVWKERSDAEAAMKAYLTDMPTTVAFVHGPQGSGKTSMLQAVLRDSGRTALFIDCRELQKAVSDTQLVGSLATQTGYWPVFTFLNSMNSLIDLASVGLIGQKTGFSSSLTDQLQQILKVVGSALRGVSSSRHAANLHQFHNEEQIRVLEKEKEIKRERIRTGTWHDGRIDCVAGNGIMSELGVGDEVLDGDGMAVLAFSEEKNFEEEEQKKCQKQNEEKVMRQHKTKEGLAAVRSLPIVVIRNYALKTGSNREVLLDVLAQWAANLAENQVAHVIIVSDNRENAKRVAKSLPSKPLNSISFSDADATSSLSFVKKKLHDAGVDIDFTSDQMQSVERLGGRASDLESLIHKVQSGQRVNEAIEDIINRAVAELRKNAFGEDAEDAQGLPWSREQAWQVLKLLSRKVEVPYYDLLLDFPFKGDETALRSMEHAELIEIGTQDGRPSTIRPGRPVLRFVFERLVNDRIFEATQEIAMNDKLITSAENTVRSCEDELKQLAQVINVEGVGWFGWLLGRRSAGKDRKRYISAKMTASQSKLEMLERRNNDLKKVLQRGER